MAYLRWSSDWINNTKSPYYAYWDSSLSSHGKQARRKTQVLTIMSYKLSDEEGGPETFSYHYKDMIKLKARNELFNELKVLPEEIILMHEIMDKFIRDVNQEPKLR